MEYVQVALAIVTMVLMIISKGKNKGKSGNIGKRYWADTIQGLATYSTRIATLWVNRIYDNSENGQSVRQHIPYASGPGHVWNVADAGVFQMATTGFQMDYMPGIDWKDQNCVNAKRNCIPSMYKSWTGGATPAYPCHLQGAAIVALNQIYLGLNGAQYPSYQAILTTIPGTVYHLMESAPEYCNADYWVRWRYTTDCGQTVTLNPVVIVAEILMDQVDKEDIDWISFAQAGRKLHKEYPFMWFAMQFGEMTIKAAVEDVLNKAKLAIKNMPDGRLGLRVIGELPENGVLGLTVVDALKELTEFTISKAALNSSEVINVASGSYAAARANSAVTTVFDVYSQVIPYDEMDAFVDWMSKNASTLVGKGIYEIVQMYPGYKTEWDIAHAANKVAAMAGQEWHYQTADIYAINAANIVSTGVRRQQNFDLSFLNWPDDASAYLQETLMQYEKPYCAASMTSGMRLWDKTIGDSIRLVIEDKDALLTIDKVFSIEEMQINGFPEETISWQMKESSKWYDVLDPHLGEPGGKDPDEPTIYPPSGSVANDDGSITLSDGTVVNTDGKVTLPPGTSYNEESNVYITPSGYRLYADGTLLDATGGYVVVPPRGSDTTPTPDPIEPEEVERPLPDQLFQMPNVAHINSPFMRGIPSANFAVNWSTPILAFTAEYLVDSASPEAIREPDNLMCTGSKTWPFNFELDEPVSIPQRAEGLVPELEINATMWVPEVADVDQCFLLLKEHTVSLAGTPGFLYDSDYDGVSYALISNATRNSPSGVSLIIRYTYMEAYKIDGKIQIRLRGIYLCDAQEGMDLPRGSVISLLPLESNALETGASAYPILEGYGIMEQGAGQSPFVRTVVGNQNGELIWNRCYAAQYKVYDRWNITLPFDIWIHNTANALGGCGEGETVVVEDAGQVLELWLNAYDFRTTNINPDMFNATTSLAPAGLDPMTPVKLVRPLIDSTEAKAGIKGLVATVLFRHKNKVTARIPVRGNRVHTTFTLAEMAPEAVPGDRVDVTVRVRYNFYCDFVEQPTSSRDITLEGPTIYFV